MITTILVFIVIAVFAYMVFKVLKRESNDDGFISLFWKPVLFLVIGLIISFVQPFYLVKVDPSGVGLKINLIGSKRGVSDYQTVSGRIIINSWTHDYVHIPKFYQTVNYEKLTVFAKGGFPINISPSFNYSVKESSAGDMYVSLRKPLNEIEVNWLYNTLINSVNEIINKYTVDYIFNNREKVEKEIEVRAQEKAKAWFTIQQFKSNLTPPQSLQQAVTQEAQAIKEAQAQQQIAIKEKAAGEAKIERAKADSAVLITNALAEAEAIKIRERQLSDKYLRLKWIETWDGKLPTHNLGSNTGIMLGN